MSIPGFLGYFAAITYILNCHTTLIQGREKIIILESSCSGVGGQCLQVAHLNITCPIGAATCTCTHCLYSVIDDDCEQFSMLGF